MKFNLPNRIEKTVLEMLCDKYGATLNATDWQVLTRMADTEIEIVLLYELKKARIAAEASIVRCDAQLRKTEAHYLSAEANGNDELCMKLMAESEHAGWTKQQHEKMYEYLGTLG